MQHLVSSANRMDPEEFHRSVTEFEASNGNGRNQPRNSQDDWRVEMDALKAEVAQTRRENAELALQNGVNTYLANPRFSRPDAPHVRRFVQDGLERRLKERSAELTTSNYQEKVTQFGEEAFSDVQQLQREGIAPYLNKKKASQKNSIPSGSGPSAAARNAPSGPKGDEAPVFDAYSKNPGDRTARLAHARRVAASLPNVDDDD